MIAGSALSASSSLSGRSGSGWQYLLADLSLILFMVTAAALASAEDAPAKPARPAVAARQEAASAKNSSPLSQQGEVLALYRAAPGAPPLGQWLRDQSADARQQLTIVAQYRPGEQARAMSQAAVLAQDAGQAGLRARIVIEPGQGGTTAALAFDSPDSQASATMAQTLQKAVPSN
ncbi:hypothetical protein [Novosphingobium sp. JCM 18896]|uniref:hypothetical protein n=1 Tax=Novosphingobium sp. JCM 18896 TaxID=2989731 RepID=UPI002221B0C6|nr:hypothetical protein [Novosphingobium sp. JCM 18896]MCW1428827.1 hypothetical protein [Novosphingobium sp. JCM 18896]